MLNEKPVKLNAADFAEIVSKTPLVSIDLIIEDVRGRVLLGLRKNEPAKDFWFVPGGRILKNERLPQAFERIAKDELGLDLNYKDAAFVGVFEHLYPNNFTENQHFSTHYVVLAHRLKLTENTPNLPNTQHSKYQWFEKHALLKEQNVHPYTRAYFEKTSAENHKTKSAIEFQSRSK